MCCKTDCCNEHFTPGPPMTDEEFDRMFGPPPPVKELVFDFLSPEGRETLKRAFNEQRIKQGKEPLFTD